MESNQAAPSVSVRTGLVSRTLAGANVGAPLHTLVRLNHQPEDAWTRHQRYIRDYVRFYRSAPSSTSSSSSSGSSTANQLDSVAAFGVTDADLLATEHRFIRDGDEDARTPDTYEKQLARKYYEKLFKEYAVADLSRYKEGRVGMRWRTEQEVFSGKGQFVCGSKQCDERNGLHSYEVNFAYAEQGQQKNALVKLRLCEPCAGKLNFKNQKEKKAAVEKERKKRHREQASAAVVESDETQSAATDDIPETSQPSKRPNVDPSRPNVESAAASGAALSAPTTASSSSSSRMPPSHPSAIEAPSAASGVSDHPAARGSLPDDADERFRGMFP